MSPANNVTGNSIKKIKTYVIPDHAQPGLEKNKDRSRHIKQANLRGQRPGYNV